MHSQMKQAKTEIEIRREELEQQADMGHVVHQLEAEKAALDGEIEKLIEEQPKSFSIVLDNVDLRVLASDMTTGNQNKDYHWCNHNAYRDRVNPTHLPDDGPIADLQEVPNSIFLPSPRRASARHQAAFYRPLASIVMSAVFTKIRRIQNGGRKGNFSGGSSPAIFA